jgi:hypothetical protein
MEVIPAQTALLRAVGRLIARLQALEARLDAGEESAWGEYAAAAASLAAIVPHTLPGASGRLLTTAEMADAMRVSTKTLLRKRARGELQAVQLARRGPGALRWRASS